VADQRSSANGAVQNSSPAVAPALSVAGGLVMVLGVDGSVCTGVLVSLLYLLLLLGSPPPPRGPFMGISVWGSWGLLWLPPVRLGGILRWIYCHHYRSSHRLLKFCAAHEISCYSILFFKLGALLLSAITCCCCCCCCCHY
jgi:hypothetical protein